MFCKQCGNKVDDDAAFCAHCGYNLKPEQTVTPEVVDTNVSSKSRLVAFLLAFFVGVLGVHNFYLGKTGLGIAQLILTITIIGSIASSIWALVDWIMIVAGSAKDSDGKIVKKWTD